MEQNTTPSTQTQTKTSDETMEQIVKDAGNKLIPFETKQIVEGEVVSASAKKVVLDISGLITGIVPERELSVLSTNLKPGDLVLALVLDLEDKKGNMILSLRRADQERLSEDLQSKFQEGNILDVKVVDANKGGLLIEIGDYQGFLPVSQLASKHYPKVEGGDPDKIFTRLKDLVGEILPAKIINFDPDQKKLIFSEKAAGDKEQEVKLSKIKEGDIVEGVVTGLVDFGIFVKIGEGENEIEGLVHISEIAWGRVANIHELYKVGDKVKVLIVSTEDNRVSLSIKRLQTDPWRRAAKKYKIGDEVRGEVTKITEFGLFVRIDSEIDGLVHLSEIGAKQIEDINEKYKIGKTYAFKIISFDPDAHRLGLSLKLEADKKISEKQAEVEGGEKSTDLISDKEPEDKVKDSNETKNVIDQKSTSVEAKSKKLKVVKKKTTATKRIKATTAVKEAKLKE